MNKVVWWFPMAALALSTAAVLGRRKRFQTEVKYLGV